MKSKLVKYFPNFAKDEGEKIRGGGRGKRKKGGSRQKD
jgi:hypothetical protein